MKYKHDHSQVQRNFCCCSCIICKKKIKINKYNYTLVCARKNGYLQTRGCRGFFYIKFLTISTMIYSLWIAYPLRRSRFVAFLSVFSIQSILLVFSLFYWYSVAFTYEIYKSKVLIWSFSVLIIWSSTTSSILSPQDKPV